MWDDWEWGNRDEDDWTRVRDKNAYRVHRMLFLLEKLKVIEKDTVDTDGVMGYVDRHWKV